MKTRIILTSAVLLAAIAANAQTTAAERICESAARTAEYQVRYNVNNAVRKAIDERFRKRNDGQRWNCPACGRKNRGNYCTHCGTQKPAEITPWECPECHQRSEGGNFCSRCGHARFEPAARAENGTGQRQAAAEPVREITLEELLRMKTR